MLSGSKAAGLQTLGQTLNTGTLYAPSLAILVPGAELYGGGNAAGRRVELPWGGGTFDIGLLTDAGRTLMQRAIDWAGGAGCSSSQPLLLMVGDAANPTAQETARRALLASWCYGVTLIDDDATPSELETAMAANDVIYISQEITNLALAGKLRDATIGVVNEEYLMSADLGIGAGTGTGFFNDMNVVNNTHYITSGFGTGPLALFDPAYDIYTGTGFTLAPDLQVLGEAGSISVLVALESGGALYGGGNAPGRRVQVAWGDDFSALNADGRTLMQRAIDWAGMGTPPAQQVLLVVLDPASLTTQEAAKKALMESWGFTVNLIDESASQGDFDAAVATADVAYIAEDITSGELGTKLREATIGVVIEEEKITDEFGISSGETTFTEASIEITDNTHYITEPFSLGAVAFASSVQPVGGRAGTLAPGLTVLALRPSSTTSMLDVIETGGVLFDTGTAAGRRVKLPWGGNDFDINSLTADGQTLMQRAIEWAADAGTPAGVTLQEISTAKGASNSKNLTIGKPPGTAAGDLLIAAVVTDGNNSASMSAPAGWNVVNIADRSGAVTLGVWWKAAVASEPADYTFSWSVKEQSYGMVMRLSGHDPAAPIDVSANFGGSSAAPISPAVTTTVPNAMILRIGGFDDDDITVDSPGLPGHTAIAMDTSKSGTNNASAGAGHTLQAAAGSSGESTFALTATEEYRSVTIGIAPAP
jgi:hypothetical protein